MKQTSIASTLDWNDEFWTLLRYFRSLRLRDKQRDKWIAKLRESTQLPEQESSIPIRPESIDLLEAYILESEQLLTDARRLLRTEDEAKEFCVTQNLLIGSTNTSNKTHHQSSKALVAAVSGIAEKVCIPKEIPLNTDPQRRAVWLSEQNLHVSARNLDGAIPSLNNPIAIWEIKEYWGKTKGGSKMSDAVYECQLVGLELRMFEKSGASSISHIVFLDGKDQWESRKSDLLRFIDLHQQGLIDHLLIGKEVESEWMPLVENIANLVM